MSSDNGLSEKERYQRYLAGREWGLLKQQVKARSGGICERCKINPSDAVHHLTYERKYNERLEDLQDTCEACHEFVHGKSSIDPIDSRMMAIRLHAVAIARILTVTPDAFLKMIQTRSETAACLCHSHAILTDSLSTIGIVPPERTTTWPSKKIGAMFGPDESGSAEDGARCPFCGFEYVHPGIPYVIDGDDNYRAGWGGRGDLIVMPFSAECGSKWELCFGFHKGNTAALIRHLKDCRDQSEEDEED